MSMTREEACAELIERHECAKYVDSDYVDAVSIEALEIAIEALKEKPHGEWLTEPHSRIIHCSNCGAEENMNKLHVAKWCYSCGADMRKEGEKHG